MGGPSADDVGHDAGSAGLDAEFGTVLDFRDIHVVFQPIVDLRSGEIVGLEALARGPSGTRLESPRDLFAAARRRGRVAELDWACRAAAFAEILAADLPSSMSLFVNIEPEAFATACPPDLAGVVARAESVLRVFVEVNDRALAADPAGLVAAVHRARNSGWGVALDDVGSSRASTAVLPVVGADLVKLDLRLLKQNDHQDASAITLNVLRHVELTGASLLVEGIENENDAGWARALGAVYGQGFYLGVPGPLDEHYPFPRAAVPLLAVMTDDLPGDSPFGLVADLPSHRTDRVHFEQLTQLVYQAALVPGASPVILACAGPDERPDQDRAASYPELTAAPLLLVLFGTGMPPEPLPGLRGVRVGPDDPLVDERFLIVLSEKGPFAVVAWSDPNDPDAFLDVVLTQEPDRVHRMARQLIRRIPALGTSNAALPGPQPLIGSELRPSGSAKTAWRDRLARRGQTSRP
jgi:EAL domain-containing protein (putative c-di-GMP-specific phosphodiesterase class I)